MGKKLIIKGADFSVNAVDNITSTWYIDVADSSWGPSPAKAASAGWCYPASTEAEIIGKSINRIKIRPSAAGTITLYKIPAMGSTGTLLASINVQQTDVGNLTTYLLSNTFVINQGEHLVFCDSTDTAFFYYKTASGNSFIKRAQYSDYATVSGYNLGIGIGYYG